MNKCSNIKYLTHHDKIMISLVDNELFFRLLSFFYSFSMVFPIHSLMKISLLLESDTLHSIFHSISFLGRSSGDFELVNFKYLVAILIGLVLIFLGSWHLSPFHRSSTLIILGEEQFFVRIEIYRSKDASVPSLPKF